MLENKAPPPIQETHTQKQTNTHTYNNRHTHTLIVMCVLYPSAFRRCWKTPSHFAHAVRLLSGPSLGVFGSYYLVQVGFLEVIIWSKFVFLAYKNSGFKRFVLHTQLSFCVFFCPQFCGNFLKIAFFKKRVQKLGFPIFSVLSLDFQNSLFLGLLKHYKNRGFSEFLCFVLLKEKKTGKKK